MQTWISPGMVKLLTAARHFVFTCHTYHLCMLNNQAVVRRPVDIKNTSINSGMLRLTCPHLIKLIDGIEGQGGVKQYNEHRIKLEEVQQNFAHVNEQWGLIKREAITPEEMSFIEEKLQEKTYDFLNSGIIGIRQSG